MGVCRSKAAEASRWLRDWDLHVAAAGRLTLRDGRPLDASRSEHNIWARESADSPWRFDLTMGSGTPQQWVYRRDQSVTRRWDRAVVQSSLGVPYLAADLQLLFKAKHPRPKDHVDAERVIPHLDGEARGFLADHLSPEHPWRRWLKGSQLPTHW